MIVFICIGFLLSGRVLSGNKTLPELVKPGALSLSGYLLVLIAFQLFYERTIINEYESKTTIKAECPKDFTYEIPDVTEENAKFKLRSFNINRPGIEGELYVFARITKEGESWVRRFWAKNQYPKLHPAAITPQIPESITCLHGIAVGPDLHHSNHSMLHQIDYRRGGSPTLSRESMRQPVIANSSEIALAIQSRWKEIITEHLTQSPLAKNPRGWKYKQKLAEEFKIPAFWASIKGMIPVRDDNEVIYASLEDIHNMQVLGTSASFRSMQRFWLYGKEEDRPEPMWDNKHFYILANDFKDFTDSIKKAIFQHRIPTNLRWLDSGDFAIDWAKSDHSTPLWSESIYGAILGEYEDMHLICFNANPFLEYYKIFNINNPLVKWIVNLKNACSRPNSIIGIEQFNSLLSLINKIDASYSNDDAIRPLINYIDEWRNLPNISKDLIPPNIELTIEMFSLKYFKPRHMDMHQNSE